MVDEYLGSQRDRRMAALGEVAQAQYSNIAILRRDY